MEDDKESVFQFRFFDNNRTTVKSSFRVRTWFKSVLKKTYRLRITFKFYSQPITVHHHQLISESTVENTTFSRVHHVGLDSYIVDLDRICATLETEIHGFAWTVANRMVALIGSSPAGSNDFLIEIWYGNMFAPNRVLGLSAMAYFHNHVHHDIDDDDDDDVSYVTTTPGVLSTHELAIKNTLDCKVTMSSTDDCAICLDELPSGCEAVNMPCSHAFHGPCIEKWLRTSHYCPLCRLDMPTTQQPTQMTRS